MRPFPKSDDWAPQVGMRLAEWVAAKIGDPRRFRNSRQVSAYAGLVPKKYQSGQMDRLGRFTGQGPGCCAAPQMPHHCRHSFATHVLDRGYDLRLVQTVPGHASLKRTMVYVHVMNKPAVAVPSPLDRITPDAHVR